MKFMEKVWGSLGLFETADQEDERPKLEETDVKTKQKNSSNVVSLPMTSQNQQQSKQVKVMVVEPFSFDDAQHIADYLKGRKPVVVNLENTDPEISKRMIDFISGTTYALNGQIQRVGNNIFLCAPTNVDVAYSPREDTGDRTLMPWVNK
ncbi:MULTISPECIES: cell division protein SepF [Sporomusa]|jgi:cell division inhibitor SepF|uniref:cell division protein SepF n=1 Tax=Sporomusa TaxID=2375 RepID=UPI00166EE3A6|nr:MULTISPECIES: cell division protein SepF [Sporomusa]MCM0757104.1 cell division protein SepF [Sporomusa sphaeroides DSM 2875]HML34440.1 cell division protein SepF [Sporomusa sphaeroides]